MAHVQPKRDERHRIAASVQNVDVPYSNQEVKIQHVEVPYDEYVYKPRVVKHKVVKYIARPVPYTVYKVRKNKMVYELK